MSWTRRIPALLLAMLLLLGVTVSAQANTADDALVAWAKEQAQPLLDDMMALAGDENYLAMVGGMMNTDELLRGWLAQMESIKPVVRVYDMPTVEDILRTQADMAPFSQYRGLGDVAKRRMQMSLPQLLANFVNQSGEVANMIAGTLVTAGQTLPKPDGFRPLLLIYEYKDITVMVSYMEANYGVSAHAGFVPLQIVEVLDGFGV